MSTTRPEITPRLGEARVTAPHRRGIPRGLQHDGPAFLSYGFRPFFLGAGVVAVAAMTLWIAAIAGGLPLGGDYGAVAWHAHEMLFGFGSAVLSGFLMTAIPNWTGQMPLAGRPLVMLASVWLAGRLAMLGIGVVGAPVAVAIDAVFLPLMAFVCGRELVAGRKWGDLKVLGGIGIVALANVWFHAEILATGAPGMSARAAVAGYVLLITIIGGRIIPSFTRNWLALRGETRLPVAFNRQDGAAIIAGLVALVVWIAAPDGPAAVAAGLDGRGGGLVAAVALAGRGDVAGAAASRAACRIRFHRTRFSRDRRGGGRVVAGGGGDARDDGRRHRRDDAGGDDAGDARAHRAGDDRVAVDGGVLPLPVRRGAGAAGCGSARGGVASRPRGWALDHGLRAVSRRVRADAALRPAGDAPKVTVSLAVAHAVTGTGANPEPPWPSSTKAC